MSGLAKRQAGDARGCKPRGIQDTFPQDRTRTASAAPRNRQTRTAL